MAKFNMDTINKAILDFESRNDEVTETYQRIKQSAGPSQKEEDMAAGLGYIDSTLKTFNQFTTESEFEDLNNYISNFESNNKLNKKAKAAIPVYQEMLADKQKLSDDRMDVVNGLDTIIDDAYDMMSKDKTGEYDMSAINNMKSVLESHANENAKFLNSTIDMPKYNAAIKAIDQYVLAGEILESRDQILSPDGGPALSLNNEAIDSKLQEMWDNNEEIPMGSVQNLTSIDTDLLQTKLSDGSANDRERAQYYLAMNWAADDTVNSEIYNEVAETYNQEGRILGAYRGKNVRDSFHDFTEFKNEIISDYNKYSNRRSVHATAIPTIPGGGLEQQVELQKGEDNDFALDFAEVFGQNMLIDSRNYEGYQGSEDMGQVYNSYMQMAFDSYAMGQPDMANKYILAADNSLDNEVAYLRKFQAEQLEETQSNEYMNFQDDIRQLTWQEGEDIATAVRTADWRGLSVDHAEIASTIYTQMRSGSIFGPQVDALKYIQDETMKNKKVWLKDVQNQFNLSMDTFSKYNSKGDDAKVDTDDYLSPAMRKKIKHKDLTLDGDLTFGKGDDIDTIDDYKEKLGENLISMLAEIDRQDIMDDMTKETRKWVQNNKAGITDMDDFLDGFRTMLKSSDFEYNEGTGYSFLYDDKDNTFGTDDQFANLINYISETVDALDFVDNIESDNRGYSSDADPYEALANLFNNPQ